MKKTKTTKSFAFKDNAGTKWSIQTGYKFFQTVESELGVGFASTTETPALMRILTDWVFCGLCVIIACREQFEAKGMTDAEFGYRVTGDALARAQIALTDAICEFYPHPDQRKAMHNMVRQLQDADAALAKLAQKQIAAIDVDKLTDELIKGARG
ncbi:hypothetical protein [Algisphaera agarilytica]|uniref:Uncharacterized protein n=1 Tax=Algisphaera agarilytica TaxID=1385975 RepID=A0A7X0HB34_9BACT|nr:hypothetical protein [Algisphaera agarilytica]MBB6431125.1 hypothetical protein [Algisphaera agarilytica]